MENYEDGESEVLLCTLIKTVYTKTEDITVTKTDPSLLIFGGGNFQMKWAKKQVSNTWTHFHHIFIKM